MKKKSSKEQQLDDAAAKKGAAPPPAAPRRRKKNGIISNEKKIPKRRRRSSSNKPDPRPRRPHIPDARVVQEPSDRAYISDDSDDWDDDDDQSDFLDPEEERLLQESIARYTTLYTPISHPEFFVMVYRQNIFSDDEGDDL